MLIFNLKGGTYCIDIEEQAKVLFTLLKQKELNMISKYTADAYTTVNRILKNSKEEYCSGEIQNIIDAVNNAFSKLPAFKPSTNVIFYRGLKLTDNNYNKILKQNVINDLGFISTTTSIDIAKGFAEAHGLNSLVMKIYFSNKYNNKILPVKSISKMPYENEVILPNGSKFVWIKDIIDEKIPNGIIRSYLYVPSLEEIPLNPELLVVKTITNSSAKKISNSVINDTITHNLITEVVEETIALDDSDDLNELLESCIDTIQIVIKNQYGILFNDINDNKKRDIIESLKNEILRQKT